MAESDLRWVATAIMTGFLRRQQAFPDRTAQWVDAVTDVLSAAAARPAVSVQDKILSLLQGLTIMGQTTQGAVDHVASSVASMKAEVQADVAAVGSKVSDLQQQIADLKAAGSGATPAQVASLESSATELDATVKALHDGLNPAPAPAPAPAPVPAPAPAPAAVVFDSADTTANSPGGRNSSHLPGFDAALPETA